MPYLNSQHRSQYHTATVLCLRSVVVTASHTAPHSLVLDLQRLPFTNKCKKQLKGARSSPVDVFLQSTFYLVYNHKC